MYKHRPQHGCLYLVIGSPLKKTPLWVKWAVTELQWQPLILLFSPSTWVTTWLPICQGNMGYLEVLIITTVNKTKRTSVFIWFFSRISRTESYRACPRGSVLNAGRPGFAEKNTVWWSCSCFSCLSLSIQPLDLILGRICHLLAIL